MNNEDRTRIMGKADHALTVWANYAQGAMKTSSRDIVTEALAIELANDSMLERSHLAILLAHSLCLLAEATHD